ncbi:hypothetical protein T265_06974 [Opisthorchis viverrini]|uniref:Uncharacterized protein n=1 Tax=Opisthorchis viverrini TaxID=6198 RepID=A0A075ACU2_OPIVI|nr:hypothetical protein T265_06974 [Opisthorchis viverrini]KER25629.1 hypothetical protein T265_06974 [Opisthorchis viverrini]
MYRNSPNPNVPGGKSPAECMFGRKIRTTYDSLRPKRKDARNAANETLVTRFTQETFKWCCPGQEKKCDLQSRRWKRNLEKTSTNYDQTTFKLNTGKKQKNFSGTSCWTRSVWTMKMFDLSNYPST